MQFPTNISQIRWTYDQNCIAQLEINLNQTNSTAESKELLGLQAIKRYAQKN